MLMEVYKIKSMLGITSDSMSEWLRRKIRNLLGLARAGSNPVTVECYSFCSPHKQTITPCMFVSSHTIHISISWYWWTLSGQSICTTAMVVQKYLSVSSATGNRTPVSRVTGGDTSHYTIAEVETNFKSLRLAMRSSIN